MKSRNSHNHTEQQQIDDVQCSQGENTTARLIVLLLRPGSCYTEPDQQKLEAGCSTRSTGTPAQSHSHESSSAAVKAVKLTTCFQCWAKPSCKHCRLSYATTAVRHLPLTQVGSLTSHGSICASSGWTILHQQLARATVLQSPDTRQLHWHPSNTRTRPLAVASNI